MVHFEDHYAFSIALYADIFRTVDMAKPLEGILALNPLPMNDHQEIDYNAMKLNFGILAANKIHGSVTFASMGQHFAPSEEEYNRVAKFVVDATPSNRVCVLGAIATNTREAIRRTKVAEDAGADAVMVASPYTFATTPDWAFEHFSAVNDSIRGEMGMIVYNWPLEFRMNITPELWDRLIRLEHIKAVKESNGDIIHHSRVLLKLRGKVNVLSGNEDWFWSDSMLGAKGITGVVVWAAPKVMLRFYEECRRGNQLNPWALSVYSKLIEHGLGRGMSPGIDLFSYDVGLLNALVEAGGGRAGAPRKPYGRLPEKEVQVIKHFATELRSM
jgi:4-hydroxy-tetrahydrodipicolinate synthase